MSSVFPVHSGAGYTFRLREHFRGERSNRRIISRGLQWGTTAWHKDNQFFLHGFDLDKQEPCSFPVNNIEVNTFRMLTDEELDVLLTYKVTKAIDNVRDEYTSKTPVGAESDD
jgi:hypothetical protein